MKLRSFFKAFMGAVAAVAIAPEIAFGRKLSLPKACPSPDRQDELLFVCTNAEGATLKIAVRRDIIDALMADKNMKTSRELNFADISPLMDCEHQRAREMNWQVL